MHPPLSNHPATPPKRKPIGDTVHMSNSSEVSVGSPPSSPSASSTHSTPTSRRTRKQVFHKPESLRAPLKITIPPPQLLPIRAGLSSTGSPTPDSEFDPDDFDSQSQSSSETSEDAAGPTTPRTYLNIIPPRISASISTSGYASSTKHRHREAADDFGLGSLRLSGRSSSSSFSSPPCSPRKSMTVRTAAFANVIPTSSARVGPFRFLRTLANGTYGTAYVARELPTGNVVCAKVCPKTSAMVTRERLRGLTSELLAYKRISTASATSRKFLMEIHGVVQDPENVLFLMDVMETDLFTYLENPCPASSVARWIAQIALGIDALHGMGIIHRDIKPENVLIVPGTSSVRVRIADFTNAWLAPGDVPDEWKRSYDVEPGAPLEPWRVYSNKLIGTREYLAPEIWDEDWYGVMVDWWAFGCLLYDLFCGDIMFPDGRTLNTFRRWQHMGKKAASYFPVRVTYLTEAQYDLMGGLLTVDVEKRFRLKNLLKHPYFIDAQTRLNVFDEVQAMSSELPRKAENRNDQLVEPSLQHLPICFVTTEPSTSQPEFDDFAWINPSGIWASP